MKKYDYDLATKIVNKLVELDVLDSADMGMKEDWFWTARPVYEEGQWIVSLMSNKDADALWDEYITRRKAGELPMFLEERDPETNLPLWNPEYKKYDACMLGGVIGSDHATPIITVYYKDGTEKSFNCYRGQSDVDILTAITKMTQNTSGCLSGPVQARIDEIDVEDFKQ